jgi:hypothetical protein
MERAKQIRYGSVASALKSALGLVKGGKITAKEITAQIADQLGVSVEHCEAVYKRFKSSEKYKNVLPSLPYVTTGQQGRPSVSQEQLDKDAAEIAALMADVSFDKDAAEIAAPMADVSFE